MFVNQRMWLCDSIGMLWAAVLVLSLTNTASVAAADLRLAPDVTKALESNVKALSPITISWTEQLGSNLPLKEWLKTVKLEPYNVDSFLPVDVTYAWQEGMSYSQTKQEKSCLEAVIIVDKNGEVHSRPGADFDHLRRILEDRELACNLKEIFSGQDRIASSRGERRANLAIDRIDNPKFFKSENILFRPSYFSEVGFVLPTKVGEQRNRARSLLLSLLDDGVRLSKMEITSFGGNKCLLLELAGADSTKRFFLDAMRGYAVVRMEEVTHSGEVASIAEMSDFVEFQNPAIWLPKRCEVVYHAWQTIPGVISKEPLTRRTFIVRQIDKNRIPAERFTLEYTMPHTQIADATLPQAKDATDGIVRFEVPANVVDLDAAIQSAIDKKPFIPAAMRSRSHRRALFIAFAGIVSVAGAIFVVRRLHRGAAQ